MVLYRSSIIIQKKFVRNKRKSKNFSFFFASRLKKRNAPPRGNGAGGSGDYEDYEDYEGYECCFPRHAQALTK